MLDASLMRFLNLVLTGVSPDGWCRMKSWQLDCTTARELTIAGNLLEMFGTLEPAGDLEFRYGTNAPTVRLEGLTVAGR